MSLCPINDSITFTLSGGHPGGEDLNAIVIKYTKEGYIEHALDDYDPAVDGSWTFTPSSDGVYNINVVGTVSGELFFEDFLVDFDARETISSIGKKDIENMICNRCDKSLYMLYKGLLSLSSSLLDCGEFLSGTDVLEKIVLLAKGGCNKELCGNGC